MARLKRSRSSPISWQPVERVNRDEKIKLLRYPLPIALKVFLLAMAAWMSVDALSSESPLPQNRESANAPRTTSDELAIVVNKKNSTDNVMVWQLRQIFSGEKRWWSRTREVKVATMPRSTVERQTMLRVVYRMNDRDLAKYFFFELYRGGFPTIPTTLSTPEKVRTFVANTPGAIGYLRASDVDASLKVVRVNGLLPGDDGYPLHLRADPSKSSGNR